MRRRHFCGRNSSGWGQSTSGWNRNCVRTPLSRRHSPQKIGKHGGQMPAWNSVGMPPDCSCGKYDCFRHTGKYICNKTKRAPPEGDALSMHLRACRFSYTCCCYRSECLLSLLSNQCYATDYSYSYSYASYRQSVASIRRRSGLSRLLGCGVAVGAAVVASVVGSVGSSAMVMVPAPPPGTPLSPVSPFL